MTQNWRVKVLTFNVNSLHPPNNLAQIFEAPEGTTKIVEHDLIAIGLQEISFHVKNYWAYLTKSEPWSHAIRQYLSIQKFVQLSCGWVNEPRSSSLILLVFVKHKHLLSIERVETKVTKTGFSGISGHKGAVCARLTRRDGTHLTFINSHLSSGLAYFAHRIKEYHTIMENLKFDDSCVISEDYVFWFGDLNFRTEILSFDDTLTLIERGCVEKILNCDQLNKCRNDGRAFCEFMEGNIKFKPTYKFFNGQSLYNPTRTPSYCDRILHRTEQLHKNSARKLQLQQLSYFSLEACLFSDHKPVTSTYQIHVYGYLEEPVVRFLVESGDFCWLTGQNNFCPYEVLKTYEPSSFDWIGVFQIDFSCDIEPVTWMYAISSWEESTDLANTGSLNTSDRFSFQNILFKRWHIPPPGVYTLGYFSRVKNCLIGLSYPFHIANSAVSPAKEVFG